MDQSQQSRSQYRSGMGNTNQQQYQANKIDLDNYVPDPNKKAELQRRLYDSGVSSVPMPSVKRPIEERVTSQPFSARMNSSKIQSLSPLKKKIQELNTNIIKELNETYKEAGNIEAKYKGEGTADYYRSQQVVLQVPDEIGYSMAGRKLQGNLGVSIQPRMTNQLLNQRKTAQIEPLDPEFQSRIEEKLYQTDAMMGPPSLVYAGFEGGVSMSQKNLELARSKYLLDKLTNKIPKEIRKRTLPPIENSQSQQSLSHSSTKKQEKNEMVTPVVFYGKEEKEKSKTKDVKNFSDLDKYIELLLDSKAEEESVFLYLNCANPSDPYDLSVVGYQNRDKDRKYYTLSGQGLTLYEHDQPIEFVSLGQWLIERDSYTSIKDFNFFKQFKKWKYMRNWKKTIKQQSRIAARNSLEEKLFILQDHFSDHLLKHRKLMIDMSGQKFMDICRGESKELAQFKSAQEAQRKKAKDFITKKSGQSRDNINQCIDSVLQVLRARIISEITLDEERKRTNPIQSSAGAGALKKNDVNEKATKLDFPKGMTYGHRSQLRKVCSKFLRFAYLVDFISLESLQKVYQNSITEMITRLEELNDHGSDNLQKIMTMDFDDANGAGQAQRGYEPMFFINLDMEEKLDIQEHELKMVPIDDFVLPPRGNSVLEEFDLFVHIEEEEEVIESEQLEEGEEPEAPVIVQKYKKTCPTIHEKCTKFSPTQVEIFSQITNDFEAGLEEINKCFKRWSKHQDMKKYADQLEEWDDNVGDGWDTPDDNDDTLDCTPWINDTEIFQTRKEKIKNLTLSAYEKAIHFRARVQPILEIYWRNLSFDTTVLAKENLKNAVDTINNVMKLFKYHQQHFQSNLPACTDIGLLQIESKKIKEKLQPSPKALNDSIEKLLPSINRDRIEIARKWLSNSYKELNRPATDVSEFVIQNKLLTQIQEKFQGYRDRVDLYSSVYMVVEANGNTKISKADEQNLKETKKIILDLTQVVNQVDQSQDQEKEKYRKKLADENIPTLNNQVNGLLDEIKTDKYLDEKNLSNMKEMIDDLDKKWAYFKGLEETSTKYNSWQETLNVPPTIFNNLDELKSELFNRHQLWHSYEEWDGLLKIWTQTLFASVDAVEIQKQAEKYSKICTRVGKALPQNYIQMKLDESVKTFNDAMPIVTALRNPVLNDDHWDEIRSQIGQNLDIKAEGFTLQSLIDMDVVKFKDEITSISVQATGEHKLKEQLEGLKDIWKNVKFETKTYKEKDGIFQLIGIDDVYTALDEGQATINMILGNRYVKVIRTEAETMKKNLITLSNALDEWVKVQKQWMYLENIFSSPEIKKALGAEATKFESIDKQFRTLMQRTNKTQTCLKVVQQDAQFVDKLKNWNDILDEITKALYRYMETKRAAFPRFYFLSDDELLEILANSDNKDVIMLHLKTLFDNLVKLDIADFSGEITRMYSREKECVEFQKVQKMRNPVETWLLNVQEEMKSTIGRLMKKGFQAYNDRPRKDWVLEHPGQIIATIAQIFWCSTTEDAINEMQNDPLALQTHYENQETQLAALTIHVRSNLTDLQRCIIVALITTDVHARDIVEDLKVLNVQSPYDFNWQKQLRYYYEANDADGEVVIKQIQAVLKYGLEYMGATSRLVITPLTDRCWITISGALHIKLGANPAGPAGTGKTESTKDLAKAIATLCIVFNCSDQVDYKMMQGLFSGLCQQGAWTCLDEFNRIDVEVLSVIAQQLLLIRNGLLAGQDTLQFFGYDIPLKPEFGAHVTMNPGYAGRTELPDNLKVMFRPVAMMIPDYRLIAEIMLFAEGFGEAKILSQKMVQLYKLSSEQLSQQDHYDFGMRAVKSVLVMAGSLKRANANQPEDAVLIRAMRDANVPKFLKDDLPLFAAIIQDLFPTVEILDPDYTFLEKQISESCHRRRLQSKPEFMKKVIYLYETFNVRFGVMLVGPTGGGKTQCYEVLADVMTTIREEMKDAADRSFQKVHKQLLNPKAISMGELYGEVNLTSQEWSDGLASKMMRASAQDLTEDKSWTIFDGPVDAIWIENMNTVLDDNMTLCLSNGQRIKLRPQMRMLFEVMDLAVASPATVSRCGMVYLTAEELGWEPFVKSWMEARFPDETILSKDLQGYLWDTFLTTINIGIEKIRNGTLKEPLKTDNLQLVKSVCNFLEAFLKVEQGFKGEDKQKRKDLDSIFAWSFAWGLGAGLDDYSKSFFDNLVKDCFKTANFPTSFTVFDYYFDMKGKDHIFKPWEGAVPKFEYDREASYFDLMVPTADTFKHAYCLKTLLSVRKNVFFTGLTGVGKTVTIASTMTELSQQDLTPVYLNFSAQTASLRVQQNLEEKLEKKTRMTYGAAPGKKVAIFVDDINMPALEFYGASPPIELLRLIVDKWGFYDRVEWQWKGIQDSTLIGCAAPPGGGRAVLTPRFTTHFNMFCMPVASAQILSKIFTSILESFLKTGFQEPVQSCCFGIIESTVEIYNKIQEELRATPAKFHYMFNLRDVSKVIQGILMSHPKSIQSADSMHRLWVNEVSRVFADRLINADDTKWFTTLVMDLLNKNFRSPLEFNDLFGERKVMFSDLLKIEATQRLYEELRDPVKIKKTLTDFLEDYNSYTTIKMNLVFFEDAVLHLLKILRTLRQPRGNIMLIGVGGSGKQSLIKLSSHIYGMAFKQIEIVKGFGESHFRDFVKNLMFDTGINVDCRGTACTMTDSHFQISETFLEDINNVLNTGEIPNLMLPEDKDRILNDVRPIAEEKKLVGTSDVVNALFVSRVREYLHICLCMSPVGETLRVRCRKFPSLVNCCTLDWFSSWPAEALLYVSTAFLKQIELPNEEIRESLAKMCTIVHTSVEAVSERFWNELRRKVYTTPKSYLDLISLYINKLEIKRKEMATNKNRLANGLKKLNDTNSNIAVLKVTLAEMQPKLVESNKQLKITLEKVSQDKAVADAKEADAMKEKEVVEKRAAETKLIKDDADFDLQQAMPILENAKRIVDNLDKASVGEIKGYANPPQLVITTMEAVVIMLGQKDISWDAIKKTIMDPGKFLGTVKALDVTQIPERTWKNVREKYFKLPDFKPDLIASKSVAAGKLCEWALALSKYQLINKDIIPKKEKAEEMDKNLRADMEVLNKTLAAVKEIKDKVAALEAQCKQLVDEKDRLEKQMARDTARMGRAEKLVVLLADEGVRWEETVGILNNELTQLVGNVFLSAACISYFGAFTGTYRKILTDSWVQTCIEMQIPCSDVFSLVKVMGDPVTIRGWCIDSLPTDQTSAENGILTTVAERWGLCIDPQQQAFKWIKNMHKKDNLLMIKFGKPTFLRDVGNAVRNGNPVLVQDVQEKIDAGLDPILLHSEFKGEGGIMQIRLGEALADYDMNFRLYMTTKLPNPHYKPEDCIKVTLINFTVTFEGLEEQLLGDVVVKEKPEVEAKRDQIVVQMANDKKTLKNIENTILKMLSESTEEQILDEDTLINVLDSSKITSTEINSRIAQATVVEEEINQTRLGYKSVAVRGSIVYFVIADMARINDMYQNSLEYIKVLFNKAIDTAAKSNVVETRIQSLIENITRNIFTNVSRGLFEKDKLIFSFLICTSIDRNSEFIQSIPWNLLLRGAMPLTEAQLAKMIPNPFPKSMLSDLQLQLLYSTEINVKESFDGFMEDLVINNASWQNWAKCENPQSEPLPGEWSEKISIFDQLIIIKAFRPEKIQIAFQNYVLQRMGKYFVEGQTVTMEGIYQDTDYKTPLIFILSTGADPTQQLLKFASEMEYGSRLTIISLGQGQGEKANALIENAVKTGDWVMLQNCHLAKTYMEDLEKRTLELQEKLDINADFRLFLTSMPTPLFPVSTLQNGVKMTTEPPKGLKANLRRSYANISQKQLDDCRKQETWCKLIFGLAFFHAIIQERRKFGPLGWNTAYEFNDSDLDTSITMLKIFLDEQEELPWDALVYVTGHINYGGRVTDDNDRRCLLTTLEKYYCKEELEDGYLFSDSGLYYAPVHGKVEVYRDYIETFPLQDQPEVFGLHENANISYQKNDSLECIETILSIQPRVSSSAGGMTPDQVVLTRVKQFVEEVPPDLDRAEGKKEQFKTNNGLLPSLTTVLLQEMEKFNRLLKVMRQSLSDLEKAIHGFIVMSDELDGMYLSLQNGVVPANWSKKAYPSLKPLASWFQDLIQRCAFINSWLVNGQPISYWISGLFFPQGFMTGCLQTHARNYKIAIDRLAFSFQVQEAEEPEELDEPPEDGVYIHGFFMDGARYNREEQVIDDQLPAELYSKMPIIWFKPMENYKPSPEEYSCPCYKTGKRAGLLSTTGQSTNFILHVDLPTLVQPSVWTRRAAAMLCALND